MKSHRMAGVLGILGLGALLALGSAAWTQQATDQRQATDQLVDQQQEEGMQVLARGPIHEAYAEPVSERPQAGPLIPKQPPDPIEEVPPDQKPAGDNVQWIPGYWAWDTDRNDFVWVSGIWRIPPPGQQWVPGHWDQVQGGWTWSPGFWTVVEQEQLEYLPPPPAPLDAPPSEPAPAVDSVFVPGNWLYRETRYVWRPGYWMDYRPGWVWIPAHYVWTPAGYIFVEGYWDFELDRRGLLFAPVYFERPLWRVASWFFRPRYVVYDDFLFGCLFVRPGFNSYYFGDYFDPTYRRLGFVTWLDYRFGRHGYDPLYSYYRWRHQDDGRWLTDLHSVYAGRFNGEIPRPPRTLVQQQTLVQNTQNINITNINMVRGLAPLNQVHGQNVHLEPVARQQQVEYRRLVQSVRDAGRQRGQAETRLLTQGLAPTRPQARPQAAPVRLPKALASASLPSAHNQPPAPPVTPRAGPRGGAPKTEPRPVQPKTEPRPTPEARPRTEPQPRPQPRTEPRPQPRTEPRPEPRPQPRAEPRPEPRPQPRSEPQPRPQPRAEPRPQPRAEPQPRPQPRVEPRPEPRPQPRAEPQPRPQPRAEPRPLPGTVRPQPRPEPRPQPRPEPRPQPRQEKKAPTH